jgi:hypothetical protein
VEIYRAEINTTGNISPHPDFIHVTGCKHPRLRIYVCLFRHVAFATFKGNAVDALCRLLRISLRNEFLELIPKRMYSFEDLPDAILIPYGFEAPITCAIHTEPKVFSSLLGRLLPLELIAQ